MKMLNFKYWFPVLYNLLCLLLLGMVLWMFVSMTGTEDPGTGFLSGHFLRYGQWYLAGYMLLMFLSPFMLAICLFLSILSRKADGRAAPLILSCIAQGFLLFCLILSLVQNKS